MTIQIAILAQLNSIQFNAVEHLAHWMNDVCTLIVAMQFCEQFETKYDDKQKIWHGPTLKPYYDRNCSFGLISFEELRKRGKHMCLISDSDNKRFTCDEVRLQAIRIARKFMDFGIRQTDIIGFAGRNTCHILAVVLACFFHGSAYHAINPCFDKKTSKILFNITKPKIIFCDGEDLERIRYASEDFETKIFTMKSHWKDFPSVLDLLEATGDEHLYIPAELEKGTDQNLAILCSSGSTGTPKAVTISHLHRVYEALKFLTQDDVQYMVSTMDWLSAFSSSIATIIHGTTMVISDKPSTPEYFLEIVQKYKITYTMLSPPAIAAIVKCSQSTPEKLTSIRNVCFGGSKTLLPIQYSLKNLLHNGRILQGYGLTELMTFFSLNLHFNEKPDSAGLLMSGRKAKIIDENGKQLGPNEVGELICYNEEKWSGYYGNEMATREMYDNERWYHTGDLGYFDEDGFLYIVDRKKELLKYHGIQYFPNQIEEVIAKISDVKEVCVIGLFNELHGDIAAAAVVKVQGSRLTPDDVVSYVQQNVEADYLRLHGGCKLFEVIPKTANGKIDRKATKNLFSKM